MARNLLAIVQSATLEMGLLPPVAVYGNPDGQTGQFLGLANRIGNELAQIEGGWEALRGEQLITTVPGQASYPFPTDYAYYVMETMWNRSGRLPIAGPVSASAWQMIQAGFLPAGAYMRFRIMAGQITFDPVPTVAGQLAIEYVKNTWCQSAAGTPQTAFSADTDIPLLPDDLFVLGLKWRFLSAKGYNYSEEMADYQLALSRLRPRDFVMETINMRGSRVGSQFLNPGLIASGGYPV